MDGSFVVVVVVVATTIIDRLNHVTNYLAQNVIIQKKWCVVVFTVLLCLVVVGETFHKFHRRFLVTFLDGDQVIWQNVRRVSRQFLMGFL